MANVLVKGAKSSYDGAGKAISQNGLKIRDIYYRFRQNNFLETF